MGVILLMVFGFPIVFFLGALAIHNLSLQRNRNSWQQDVGLGTIFGVGVSLIPILAVTLSVPLTSVNTAKELEAFYEADAPNIIEEARLASLGLTSIIRGDFLVEPANRQQMADYLTVLRNGQEQFQDFNRRLKKHKFWQDSTFLGALYINVDNELQLLKLDHFTTGLPAPGGGTVLPIGGERSGAIVIPTR